MADHDVIPPILERTKRRGARAGLSAIAVCAVILLVCQGPSIERSGERLDPGPIRTAVLAVGRPADWLADRLPAADAVASLTRSLSPERDDAAAGSGFATPAPARGVVPVTPDSFIAADLGMQPPPKRALRKLLVTGDSMVMPLDSVVARRFAGGKATAVIRDPHLGTAISKTGLVDWGRLATRQTGQYRPDAVIVFIGANEGFPLEALGGRRHECCDAAWAAAYATRARAMMDTYRRAGAARVYWLSLPLPRDKRRQVIARAVNAAVRVAAQAYRAQVRVLDMVALFTPHGTYRDDMPIGGKNRLVREADGIHLNELGAELAEDAVARALAQDFEEVPAIR